LLAVVLTGMGQDGLVGAKAITAAGGSVIAQDEASSVVWGMPGAVVKAGLASDVVALDDVAGAIVRRVMRGSLGKGPVFAQARSGTEA
jgi:two-component system chemotaxis response regulator CheB